MSTQTLKTVVYRGGLVRLALPSHWVEEHDPDGGATFYDPAVEAVTLRLNVLTMRGAKPLARDEALAALRRSARLGEPPIEALPEQHALRIELPKQVEEQGELLEIHSWQVARVAPPDLLRIAVFSTTLIAAAAATPATRATMSFLLDQVRGAVVSDAAGPTA